VVSDLEKVGLITQNLHGRDEAKYALPYLSEVESLNIQCADLTQINKASLIASLEQVFQAFDIDVLDIKFSTTLLTFHKWQVKIEQARHETKRIARLFSSFIT
jgi:Fur family ferric uptake transcriptional regulator